MDIIARAGDEVDALLADLVRAGGLFACGVADGRRVDGAVDAMLDRWRRGEIYLRDDRSRIARHADLSARRLIIRQSAIGSFVCITGDGVAIDRSTIGSHSQIAGRAAIVQSLLESHVVVGPDAYVVQTGMMPFSKAQRYVRIERSGIGSGCMIDGGTHPEKMPLGPHHRVLGVRVERDCWIGQHCSLGAGAIVGAGGVVAPFTAIASKTPQHRFISGHPLRYSPIDLHLRGLDEQQARAEGQAQGINGLVLPIYGDSHGAFTSAEVLEIDYPQHGHLSGLSSTNLLHFQGGALEAGLALLFPEYRTVVTFAVGASVRFHVRFDHAFDRASTPHAEAIPAGVQARVWHELSSASSLPAHEPVAVAAPAASSQLPESGTMNEVRHVILGLLPADEQDVPCDVPFQALGLDSVGFAELAAAIEKLFAIEAPDVFSHNTLRSLASAIDASRQS